MRIRYVALCLTLLLFGAVGALAQGDLPAAADLDDGWNYLTVEGATCARGTPYTFAARPGDPEKLHIYFQGGGACWDNFTCRMASTFKSTTAVGELEEYQGVFDFANPENPLGDYSVAVITYCSADVHTGEATATYGEGSEAVEVTYNGVANTRAVLDWVYANYESPDQLVISGSSAGAYGAIYHAASILDHYSEAQAIVLGDAGLGVTPPDWEGLDVWNMSANLSEAAASETSSADSFNAGLYAHSAAAFPNATFAEYTSTADQVQIGFFGFMGGESEDWAPNALRHLDTLNAMDNYRSYLAWGDSHTILAYDLFYTMQVDGVRFRDWFADMVSGESVVSVACEDCETEEFHRP
ncbi:MAG: hypothetical protein IPK19_01695 [Chloroflexi bacterium]|nr:hypothetical protein [Chloroflexota bacterium]